MRLAHAVLAGLVLGGGVGWWTLGHPGYETTEQAVQRKEAAQLAQAAAEPKLYRWRNAQGVLQLTDKPPKSGKFEVMESREEVNVIPMSVPEPEPETPAQ